MLTWVALKDKVKQAKILLTTIEPCSNPECHQEQLKNYHAQKKNCIFLRSPTIWKVMPRNVWNVIVNWHTRLLNNFKKVSTPCLDDHHFKEEELKSVEELSDVCSQIVLICLSLASIGRPDILWSVNKLARAVTKWSRTCDKSLARLISFIYFTTSEYKQYVTGEIQLNIVVWDCFKTLTLREILKFQNRPQAEHCAHLEAIHLFL